MKINKAFCGVFMVLINLLPLIAGTTGKISGTVMEKETGEPIIGANLILQGTLIGASSDIDGSYFILNIPPGTYNIEVTYIGYSKLVMENVQVVVDRTTNQDFLLGQETIQGEGIVVIASRPIVEKDRTNSMAVVNSSQIETLPVQEVEDLIQLQAGITRDASGKFHMRGGRAGEIAYLVDGIPVSNQYSGGSSIEMENNWIQEMQVISGTFNAEYGQAQSGIINVISKRGPSKFFGNASAWIGDYVSSQNNTFLNIDETEIGEVNADFSFGGPFNFLPTTSYLFSFRYYDRKGWLYGENRTRIEDTWKIQEYYHEAQQNPTDEERILGIQIPDSLQTGDGLFLPLNGLKKYNGYATLNFQLSGSMNLQYSLFASSQSWKSYSDARRYAPSGVPEKHRISFNNILNFTYTHSQYTFSKIGLSYSTNDEESYLFEDPLDERYQGIALNLNGFYFGGTNNSRYQNKLTTLLGKYDVTSQMNKNNLVKFGLEFRQYEVFHSSLTTISRGSVYNPPNLEIPVGNTSGNNAYTKYPYDASIYLQDKLEFDEIVFNAGVRLDIWNAMSEVLVDPTAITDGSDGIRLSSETKKSDLKYQVSPRFGLAFPISEKGVIHVSYGHFFQVPRFSYIFRNSEFEVELGDLESIMGNANLNPEVNIAYELGLQQELAPTWGLQLTAYYKDIKNLLGQEIIVTDDKKIYARYINRDYGNVKGITIALEKLYSALFSGSIDYTYQVARGNASDPNSVFYDNQSHPPKEGEKQVVPLAWDQLHTINIRFNVGNPKNWNLGIVGRFATGQPYTPTNPGSALTTQFENSARKPAVYNIDLNLQKKFPLLNQQLKVFLRIYNLLDQLNGIKVFSSTGNSFSPYRTNAERDILNNNPNFTLNEIDLRPDFYSEPRRIILGISIQF